MDSGVQQRHTTTLHVMLAFLLFGIGIVCGGLYWFTSVSPVFKSFGSYKPFLFFGIACLLASIAILVLTIFQKKWLREERNNLLFRLLELVLVGSSSLLFFLNKWMMPASLFGLMSAVIIFAIIRERRASQSGHIIIDEKGIAMHLATRSRLFNWKEIEGVLLRFGTLTVEFADNKMIQQNIAAVNINNQELEDFSRQKVEQYRTERINDNW